MHNLLPDTVQVYLVGGAVRDELLGIEGADRDWVVVGATPELMLDCGFRQVGRDFPVFLHPDSGEEYALARTERKRGAGHTGFVCDSSPTVTLEQDLMRRDLTVNAIAKRNDGSLIDPWGGQQHLQQKLLHHVSDAFSEDPLRVLRSARFLARFRHLGFNIADATMALMQTISDSGELKLLSAERIWNELVSALNTGHPSAFFQSLADCGALGTLIPSLNGKLSDAFSVLDLPCSDPLQTRATLLGHLSGECWVAPLKAPKQIQRLAQLGAQWLPLSTRLGTGPAAEQVMALLQSSDWLRQTDNLEWLLQAATCLEPVTELAERIRGARDVAAKLRVTDLEQPPTDGKALGAALQQARILRIQQFLQEAS